MSEEAEVKIKLVADDHASAATARVGSAFTHLAGEAKNYAREVAQGVITGTIALHAIEKGWEMVGEAGHKAYELIGEAFHAALNEGKEIKEVAASLSMSTPAASMKQLKDAATVVHEEMEELGIKAGIATDAIGDAFNQIAARSTKTIEELQALTENMAMAGKVIPGGLSALATGFTGFEQGMIRARNPVVMLIAQTNLLKGNAHQVAAALQKMSPEQQMKLGEKAIEMMAKKAKDIPIGFSGMVQSLKDMKENVLESMGGPILDGVKKVMGDVRTFFMAHQEQIGNIAEAIGEEIGEFIGLSKQYVTDFIGAFSDVDASLGHDVHDAFEDAKESMKEILANGRAMAKALMDTWEAGKTAMKWAGTAVRVSAAVSTLGGSEVAIAGAKYVGGKMGLGDAGKAQGELPSEVKDKLDAMNKMAKDVNAPMAKVSASIAEFKSALNKAGMNSQFDEYKKGFQQIYDTTHQGVAAFDQAAKDRDAHEWVAAYNQAARQAKTGDIAAKGAMQYAEKMLAGNLELQISMEMTGDEVEGGFAELGKRMRKAGNASFADVLGGMAKSAVDALSAGKGAGVHMSGGQTFHIKQDFRDQDPDRIALVFRSDIMKASLGRISARTSSPFGL